MGAIDKADAAASAGLEQIRRAERLRMSRALHDEVGPALCSAGLMLGMMKEGAGETGELAEAAQKALEQAVEAVRGLSYSADPDLVKRCGARAALESLAKWHGAELASISDDLQLSGEPGEAACRIVHDALLMQGGPGGSIETVAGGLAVSLLKELPEEITAALQETAAEAGLRLHIAGSRLTIRAGGPA